MKIPVRQALAAWLVSHASAAYAESNPHYASDLRCYRMLYSVAHNQKLGLINLPKQDQALSERLVFNYWILIETADQVSLQKINADLKDPLDADRVERSRTTKDVYARRLIECTTVDEAKSTRMVDARYELDGRVPNSEIGLPKNADGLSHLEQKAARWGGWKGVE